MKRQGLPKDTPTHIKTAHEMHRYKQYQQRERPKIGRNVCANKALITLFLTRHRNAFEK